MSNLKEPVSWHVLSVIVQTFCFDPGMGEQVCAGCGVILAERLESLEEGKFNTFDKVQNFSNIGLPSSLTQSDSLSTIIPYSEIDGNGQYL